MVLDNSDYGQVHYMLFHRLLPTALRNEGLEEFIELCEAEQQGEYLSDAWSNLLEEVGQDGEVKRLRGFPPVTAGSFPLLLDAPIKEHRLLVIGAPLPHMTPQVRYIACWFDSADPQKTLRYFAAELSMEEAVFGDVLGEWTNDGAHRNFGIFCAPGDSTPKLFAGAIVRLCTNGTATLSTAGDVARDGAKRGRKVGGENLSREEVRARIARRVRSKDEVQPSAKVTGPLTWESESSRISSDIVGRLRSAQSAGQSVLIASAANATGLRTAVSTFLQFKILNKKKLLAEVQGDYSYWGVSIQSREWTKFTVLGFDSPSSSNGNFSIVYQDFRDDRKLLDWLTHTVGAMQEVLAPEGEISYKGF